MAADAITPSVSAICFKWQVISSRHFKSGLVQKRLPLPWPDSTSKEMGVWKELHERSALLPHCTDLSPVWDQTQRFAGDLVADRWGAIRPRASLHVSSDHFPAHTASPRAPHWAALTLKSVCFCSYFPSSLQPLSTAVCMWEKLCLRTVPGNGLMGHEDSAWPNRAHKLLFMHLLLWSPKAH